MPQPYHPRRKHPSRPRSMPPAVETPESLAFKRAVKRSGGFVLLAQHLGIDPSFLSHIGQGRAKLPAGHVVKTVQFCRGLVQPHELRPDIFPAPGTLPEPAEPVA